MRKFLALMVILLVILGMLLEFVLPRTVANILEEQIANNTSAQEINVSLSAKPNARIALGEIDRLHATAETVRIGEINFKNLTLDGDKIRLDVPELLMPNKDIPNHERIKRTLKHADKIELRGIITEGELKSYVVNRENSIKNPEVQITPEIVNASAQIKFFGRDVDIDVAGVFIVNNGDIFFHVSKLNTNSILSRINLDSFVTDVKVVGSENLPIGLKFDSVELRDGEIVITAVTSIK